MIKRFFPVLFTLVVTALTCWAAWWLWNEVPGWLRRTEFSDYGYLASLLCVFLVLSFRNPLMRWVWDHCEMPWTGKK